LFQHKASDYKVIPPTSFPPHETIAIETKVLKDTTKAAANILQEKSIQQGITTALLKNAKEIARQKLAETKSQTDAIPITDSNLQSAWADIALKISNNKPLYKNAVLKSALSCQDTTIIIESNHVAAEFLQLHRQQLLDFFKKQFQNEQLNVQINLASEQQIAPEEYVLSTREIFEKMSEINPLLHQLKMSLGNGF
jgi:hypothetical protein